MSGTSARKGGVVSMTINGEIWDVVGDCEYSPVTVTRETVKGQSAVEGYSEMPMQGHISANLRDRSDQTVFSLNSLTNANVVVNLANGKTVFGMPMWQTGEISVRTMEGSFAVRFEGPNVTELTL